MKSLGYELVSAEYTNSEYNSIRAFWRDPENTEAEDGSELFTESVIEVNDDSFQYKELLELTSLDTIMQDTYVNNQKRVTAFENMVVPIAKERGLVYDLDQGIDSNIYKAIVKALFSEFDPVSQKEQLFMLKMELFNVDFIKEVKDRAMKKELRQAPDLMSTVEAACKIYRATKES
jgi:hypothetical protein